MKQKNVLLLLVALTLAWTLQPGTALAQGFLQLHQPGDVIVEPPINPIERRINRPIPRPIPRPSPIQPAELTNLVLEVDIADQVATTMLDQTFRNPNNMRLEGTYYFPLPANAAVKNLSLYIDGKPVKCEVLEAQKAREIYEGIVRQARDPALLEYVGRDLVKLRIFPIEPHQSRRVRFQYSQFLKEEFGQNEYIYPLVAQSDAARQIGQFVLKGSISAKEPIATVYSPTHKIDFVHKGSRRVEFAYERDNHEPTKDLRIYYGTTQKDLGASVVTYRKGDDKGTFLLMIAPRRGLDEKRIIPKDITFVFDTSGSMSGDKIKQARDALKFCLNTLREQDRFRIIRFSTETEMFRDDWVDASEKNRDKALRFVEDLTATGGTAIDAALTEALKTSTKRNRPHIVVFLTDGLPTIGETNVDNIVRNATKQNDSTARIFSFGVGFQINTRLLDLLSEKNGGTTNYVTPTEDIEVKVSNFFRKISDPVLTDIEVDFGDVRVSDTYPRQLPDLFSGSQVTLIGRFNGSGRQTVTLKGREGDKMRTYEYELNFPKTADNADFLPRLWAIRRVGHLVDEIRKNGENSELRDEVVRLGKTYAIATPYTSLLVTEDEAIARRPMEGPVTSRPMPQISTRLEGVGGRADGVAWGATRGGGSTREKLSEPASVDSSAKGEKNVVVYSLNHSDPATLEKRLNTMGYDSAQGTKSAGDIYRQSGREAVVLSRKLNEMKERESGGLVSAQNAVKQVGDTTFYLKNGIWTQSNWDEKSKTIDVEYGTDAYFDLLFKNKDMGKFLALGQQVIFQFEDKWYRITPAKEKDAVVK